ncbi:MAG: TetR family transcriptional regulator [Myxococcales bacterium]|nr:TetR family transcriptional regulator [Myxococcales bacterium]
MSGLRERKKQQTADDLHRIAMVLFFERGFEGVTAEEIAERAEVSPRTFYRYYPVKAAVVFPRHAARLEAFADALAKAPGETPFRRVRDALLSVATDYQSRAEIEWRTWDLVQASDTLTAYELRQDREWIGVLQRALSEPVGSQPGLRAFEARVMAHALIGAVRATLGEWFEGKGEEDLQRMGEASFALLEQGVTSEERDR